MKIVTVVGARPQFIKAAALSKAIKDQDELFEEVLVHTGQHFDRNMSHVFFEQLEIPEPKYKLDCGSLSHGAMTGLALQEIEKILIVEKPNFVLVYGDTNATLAGALAASKLHIPVVHVESGLRSFDPCMPEETNRVLTDSLSSILCCPSKTGVDNLKGEGFPRYDHQVIVNTGDIQYDSTLLFSGLKKTSASRADSVEPYLVLTLHRPSNVDSKEKLESLFSLLKDLSKTIKIVFPVHPRTHQNIQKFKIDSSFLEKTEPLGYTDMLDLIKGSKGVITDSGGLQKEAFYLLKKTLVLRDSTEWTELVDNGSSLLADENTPSETALQHLLSETPTNARNVYGDGQSAQKILSTLLSYTNDKKT